MRNIKMKDNVVISGECYKLFAHTIIQHFERLVAHALDEVGYVATITSARDGEHSKNSLHKTDRAIDLRTKDLPLRIGGNNKYLEGIVLDMGFDWGEYVFILHLYDGKQHLHVQHGRENILSFGDAQGEHNNVFLR